MKTYIFNINPCSKPRMTKSDKWKKRITTSKYWGFKDELKLQANLQGLKELPTTINCIDFYIPMPESWSKKKKTEMDGKLHTQKPDIDNLLKGLMDALCKEDSHIAMISERLSKSWAYEGKIEIEF